MRKSLTGIVVCFLAAGCGTPDGAELKSRFDTGVAAYDAGDYPKAYAIWSAIEDEDLAARRNVAMMLRRGQGVTRDPKKAEELYQLAAQAGLPTAQADLADMLLRGEAGPPDPKSALPLLEAAAAADHPLAQYELAEMFETGQDGLVPKDMATARRLYAAAAGHGMAEAKDRLAVLGPQPPGPAPFVPAPPAGARPVTQP